MVQAGSSVIVKYYHPRLKKLSSSLHPEILLVPYCHLTTSTVAHMSSFNAFETNPLGDSSTVAQGGVPTNTGASQRIERAVGKEEFSEKEMSVLQKYVEKFKVSTKAERHKLLVLEVLPELRTFNLHLNQEKWDLRKAVSDPSYTIQISKGHRRSSRSKSGFKTTAGGVILHSTCH